jgi:hypothetical protein
MQTLFDNIPDEPEPLKVQEVKKPEIYKTPKNVIEYIEENSNNIEPNLIEDFNNSMVDFEKIEFENFKLAEKFDKIKDLK